MVVYQIIAQYIKYETQVERCIASYIDRNKALFRLQGEQDKNEQKKKQAKLCERCPLWDDSKDFSILDLHDYCYNADLDADYNCNNFCLDYDEEIVFKVIDVIE